MPPAPMKQSTKGPSPRFGHSPTRHQAGASITAGTTKRSQPTVSGGRWPCTAWRVETIHAPQIDTASRAQPMPIMRSRNEGSSAAPAAAGWIDFSIGDLSAAGALERDGREAAFED